MLLISTHNNTTQHARKQRTTQARHAQQKIIQAQHTHACNTSNRITQKHTQQRQQ